MDNLGVDQSVYTIESGNGPAPGYNLGGNPPAIGFNLEETSTAPPAPVGFVQPQPTPGAPVPVVLSPQQLPGYPTNPPEYSQVPPPNYSNQPTGYPQFVPGYQQQPGIHHTFADGTNQAVITPVIITTTRVDGRRRNRVATFFIFFMITLGIIFGSVYGTGSYGY